MAPRSLGRVAAAVCAAALFLPATWEGSVAAAVEPELPRVYLDTTYVPPKGRTIAVPAGGDFQAALIAAQPGDVITLAASATYGGPFTLPKKPGAGWITVRTSVPDAGFPSPGTRVTPAHAPLMPRLVSGSGSVITTAPGAQHYRFIGIEISPSPGTFLYNLVLLGSGERVEEDLPTHIIFDRSYLHGDPVKGRPPRGRDR